MPFRKGSVECSFEWRWWFPINSGLYGYTQYWRNPSLEWPILQIRNGILTIYMYRLHHNKKLNNFGFRRHYVNSLHNIEHWFFTWHIDTTNVFFLKKWNKRMRQVIYSNNFDSEKKKTFIELFVFSIFIIISF